MTKSTALAGTLISGVVLVVVAMSIGNEHSDPEPNIQAPLSSVDLKSQTEANAILATQKLKAAEVTNTAVEMLLSPEESARRDVAALLIQRMKSLDQLR